MPAMPSSAALVLADGSVFYGTSIGVPGSSTGEVVFNTAMTGYQEILTDPSYAKQIVTLTYPHIGNTGCNAEDNESASVWASGLVIRDLPLLASNFRSEQSLQEFLLENNVVAIADIDTRRLTRILRDKGAQNGTIVAVDSVSIAGDAGSGHAGAIVAEQHIAEARELTQEFGGLAGLDLAKEVSCQTAYQWREGSWQLGIGHSVIDDSAQRFHVVAYDFGVKRNILRMLADRGCRVTVVPAQTPAEEVLAMNPDGVFLSNGPGDPEPCDYAITAIQKLLETDLPIFGICLGHQLLALASGAGTIKMKFGHHGANHPVQNLQDETVLITSQNHGFAVDEANLPSTLSVTHKSLFDGSLQGIHRNDKPAFGFQGHPEASPGPHDAAPLFDHFIELLERAAQGGVAQGGND